MSKDNTFSYRLEEIRKSLELYKLLLNNSEEILYLYTVDMQLIFVNDSFRLITGYDSNELCENTFLKFIHPDDITRITQLWHKFESGSLFENVKCRFQKKNGSDCWLLTSFKLLKDEFGNKIGIIGTQRVITQDPLKEDPNINDLNINILCNMSHELRTPLTAIMGFTKLLLLFPDLEEEKVKKYLNNIYSSGEHLLALVDDILDFSKIESKAMKFNFETVDPSFYFSNVCDEIRSKAIEKNLALSLNFKTDIPKKIQMDPTRMRQILYNLIGNGIKFTEAGFICVDVSFDETSDEFIIDIQDTGIGIDSSGKESLFSLFNQLNTSITRKYGGSGIGLYLSKKLAQEFGGDIKLLFSKPGVGSTFRLSFKANFGNTNLSEKSILNLDEDENVCDLSDFKILIVEDNEDVVFIIKHIFDDKNISYDIAIDGKSAVNQAHDENFDIILMDLQLPEMGGRDAASLIRKDGFSGQLIAMSAFTSKRIINECLEGDFDYFVQKPIEIDKFINVLKSCCS